MAGILLWAGQQFASGIVSAGGGAVFSEILGLAGLGSAAGVDAKLDGIINSLNDLVLAVGQISASIASLHSEILVSSEDMSAKLTEAQLLKPVTELNAAYGSPKDGVSDNPESLFGLLLSAKVGPRAKAAEEMKARIDKETERYIRDLGIGLSGDTFGTSKPLLGKWTDLMIAKMRSSEGEGDKVYKYYLVFEGYFMQAVAAQLKGVALLAASEGAGAPRQPGPERDRALAEAMQKARQHVQPLLHRECAHFVDCAERLVLSQLELPPGPTPFRSGVLHKECQRALMRADVLAAGIEWLGIQSPLDPQRVRQAAGWKLSSPMQIACSGTYGRFLCKPNTAVAVDPKAQTVRIEGGPTMLGVSATCPDADSGARAVVWRPSGDSFGMVANKDESRLQVVRVRGDFSNEVATDGIWMQRYSGRNTVNHPPYEDSQVPSIPSRMLQQYPEFYGEFDLGTLEPVWGATGAFAPRGGHPDRAWVASFLNLDPTADGPVFSGDRKSGGIRRSMKGSRGYLQYKPSQWNPTPGATANGYAARNDVSVLWPQMTAKGDALDEAFSLVAVPPGRSQRIEDHLEQVTDAPLFRAERPGDRLTVRVNGYLTMSSRNPVQSWVSNIRHRVTITVVGSDGTSQTLFEHVVDFGNQQNPPTVEVADGFECRATIVASPRTNYTLSITHVTDSLHMDGYDENSLYVRLNIYNVAVVWPPEDIVVS
jgi:hypothetical protein